MTDCIPIVANTEEDTHHPPWPRIEEPQKNPKNEEDIEWDFDVVSSSTQ